MLVTGDRVIKIMGGDLSMVAKVQSAALTGNRVIIGHTADHILIPIQVFPAIAIGNRAIKSRLANGDSAMASLANMGDLLVSGIFLWSGSSPVSRFARWDGRRWSAFASPNDGTAIEFVPFNQALIAIGFFTTIGGEACTYVGSWDKSAWTALGALGGLGQAGHLWNTTLVAAYGPPGGGASIRTWNGSSWDEIGTADGPTYCIATYAGKLIVGGAFNNIGGSAITTLAAWDGASWSSIGLPGPPGVGINAPTVFALAMWNGNLIAAGRFITIDGNTVNRIASYDGINWSALGSGLNNTGVSLAPMLDRIVVCGSFTTAGGNPAARIAEWNRAEWIALATSVTGSISVVTAWHDTIIAGGSFTAINGISAINIAHHDGISWNPMGDGLRDTPPLQGYVNTAIVW